MITLVIVLQLVTLAAALYAARKALWASRLSASLAEKLDASSQSTTRQMELLDGLYRRLGFERGSLPPTRGWAASPDFLNVLLDQVQERRPKNLVECGSGLTTIVTARALQQQGGGKLWSLDHDATFAEITRRHLRELGLEQFVEMHVAPLAEHEIGGKRYPWYDLDGAELPDTLDMLVVDGPPIPLTGDEGRYPALPLLADRLTQDAVVLLDDAGRPGERRIVERYLAEFPAYRSESIPTEKGCTRLTRK